MSLRTRLVISFTVLLLVVIAAVGLVASRSIEGILVGQIDRTLVGFATRGPGPTFQFQLPGPDESAGNEEFLGAHRRGPGLSRRERALRPSVGLQDDPDPLPDVSNLPDTTEPFTVPAVDGSFDYRAIVVTLPEQLTEPEVVRMVHAAPLTAVDEATDSLIEALVLAGLVVLLLGGVATWWMVKRAMRPVDQMVDTAEAIASGDLSQRVPDLDPGTELGRLGGSLNEMLAHIEAAVETEKEGTEASPSSSSPMPLMNCGRRSRPSLAMPS